MSVLTKGMDMPENCWDCPCLNGEDGYCQLRKEYVYGDVPRSCPLVPVPPHGRLIDADALNAKFKEMGLGDNSLVERLFADGVYAVIDNAPTVIEAEE